MYDRRTLRLCGSACGLCHSIRLPCSSDQAATLSPQLLPQRLQLGGQVLQHQQGRQPELLHHLHGERL